MKNISFLPAAGCLLGAALFGWVLFFYNKGHSNKGFENVDQYIKDCITITLKINEYKNTDPEVKGNARMLGTPSFYNNQTIFYVDEYKKYFVIEFITGGGSESFSYSSFIEEIQKGETLTAIVNKTELNDTNYGTQKKPVPIFSFSRDNVKFHKTYATFVSGDGTYSANPIATEKQYKGSIGFYLSHIKSKTDFEKMFGKQK